jgi:hypothetical protein
MIRPQGTGFNSTSGPHLQLNGVRDVELQELGPLGTSDRFGWVRVSPVFVPMTGRESEIVLEGYVEDDAMQDFEQAVDNFLSLGTESLRFCERWVFEYYQDSHAVWDNSDVSPPQIGAAAEVWSHVRFGGVIMVSRRAHGDRAVYISIECECDWEPEHRLQLVFRKGERVTKIGPFDGYLSNADALGRPELEHVVYVRA